MEKQNLSISSFKQFCIKILGPLLLVVSIVGLVFNYFFENQIILKSQISGAYKVNRIISETHPNEIPIFGSSRALMGLIPDSLGSDYFNYGINGTFYNVTLFFLEEECKKKKNRPWIILNLDPFGLGYGIGDVSSYVYNANNKEIKILLDSNYKPYFSVPFIKYFGRFDNYYRLLLSNKIELTKITNNGATFEKNPLPKQDFERLVKERNDAMPAYQMNPVIKEKLLNIITSHPDRNFLFVIAPYHPSCPMGDSIQSLKVFCQELSSYKNVIVYDFSKLLPDDDMFFNISHINYKGAILFSRAFKDSLIALGIEKQPYIKS